MITIITIIRIIRIPSSSVLLSRMSCARMFLAAIEVMNRSDDDSSNRNVLEITKALVQQRNNEKKFFFVFLFVNMFRINSHHSEANCIWWNLRFSVQTLLHYNWMNNNNKWFVTRISNYFRHFNYSNQFEHLLFFATICEPTQCYK